MTYSIGPFRRTCYALAVLPIDVVHRSTIRAMLPRGSHRNATPSAHVRRVLAGNSNTGRENRVTRAFAQALKDLERKGLIARGREFILIHDHGGLLDEAFRSSQESRADPIPLDINRREFVEIDRAVSYLQGEIRRAEEQRQASAWIKQRHAELAALRELQSSPPVPLTHIDPTPVRLRTGRDDHLEMGVPKRKRPDPCPPKPSWEV